MVGRDAVLDEEWDSRRLDAHAKASYDGRTPPDAIANYVEGVARASGRRAFGGDRDVFGGEDLLGHVRGILDETAGS
jgi:hypothetical protein